MLLKPEILKHHLRSCGYRKGLLRSDFSFGNKLTAPLVGFAHVPTDSRSACVVALDATSEPRQAVEACRPIGAPLIFVCADNGIQWWKQGRESAEWLETIPSAHVEKFFQSNQDKFSPEAIYRAKTLGRIRSEYQLDFIDSGMMPLIEEEVGSALSRLISRNVAGLKNRLGWGDVTSEQGQWLLQTIFWLVSGKILRDKQVPNFGDLNLNDIDDVFHRVGGHYGTQPFQAGSKQKLEALQVSARTIEKFSSLALTTSESLAYVYENTLISKATRSQLGTHSTPSYLVDYVLGHLADWIEEIPENDRSVFEPACGHAAFLVSAMRMLTQLLPAEKAIPSRRGPYLRSRLHGTDIDAFALELARLSLTLTDIPNPDGWDLRTEDMFIGDRLTEQTTGNTILLANPPFANFAEDEITKYSKAKTEIVIKNKAAEMLRLTLPALKPGSVFGLVLPQSILHGAFAEDVRRFIVENFELREVSLFPDKVFSFSDVEAAILIGRRVQERSKRNTLLRFRRIREREMPAFKETYLAPSSTIVRQSRFNEDCRWDLRVPDLQEVWDVLEKYPRAGEFAEFGTGLVYHGRNLPRGVPTYSNERFRNAIKGFIRFERGLALHELPRLYWMNLAEEATLSRRAGVVTGTPQVLMSYARVSRGPWRLKALIDRHGHPVASRFLTARPQRCSLIVLWALLNSPVANAYAFTHLEKRDNIVSDIRQIPMPETDSFGAVESAAEEYVAVATTTTDSELLRRVWARVDAEVLKSYALPLNVESSLLSLFDGWDRVGVAFKQLRFLPQELEGKLHYSDFIDYETNWSATNRRRGKLIDKDISDVLTDSERVELDGLQAYADYHLDQVAPRPTESLARLEDLILAKTAKQGKSE